VELLEDRRLLSGVFNGYTVPTAQALPNGITAGKDSNLWFTELNGDQIGRITPAGVITEFQAGLSANAGPYAIAARSDGNLWFTESLANQIGRITPAGVITEFPITASGNSAPRDIAAGPDGNLWFAQLNSNQIGQITPAGVITEFQIPTAGSSPVGITSGPDGNLWFTESHADQIGRITPSGVVTEFQSGLSVGAGPLGITAGPDGNLWFAETGINSIGRITPTGVITEFPFSSVSSGPAEITTGPDGNLWFTESKGPGSLGQITPGGTNTVTILPIPSPNSSPWGIATGPDGNLWFADPGPTTTLGPNQIGELTFPAVSLRVTATSNTTAGAPFSVTVTALNSGGLTETSYTGTVHFGSNDGQAVLPSDYTFTTADKGKHTFTNAVTLNSAGSRSIVATDTVTSSVTGSKTVTVKPAAATYFNIKAPASSTAGIAFSVTVFAMDPFGNLATGYAGTVHFASSDSQATLPADYIFVAADKGRHTFTNQVTLRTTGSQIIRVNDTTVSSMTGSNTVTVNAPKGGLFDSDFDRAWSVPALLDNDLEQYFAVQQGSGQGVFVEAGSNGRRPDRCPF
jgi:streptogramin lyase